MAHITHTVTQKDPHTLRVVHITDTHLFSGADDALLGVKTEQTFLAVLEKSLQENPECDFILMTGDIAQQQDAEIYQRFFKHMNATGKPYFCLPGNHDVSKYFASTLYSAGYADNQVIETAHWRFILLNSSVKGTPSGKIKDADLAWLDAFLGQQDDSKHTMVCLHHHPIPMNSAWIDQHMLQDADMFLQVLSKHANVNTLCCGHVHQAFDQVHEHIRIIATPSTSIQFKPQCDDFTVDALPSGFREFSFLASGDLETTVKRLDNIPSSIELNSKGY